MKMVVISHKICWRDPSNNELFATDGGFPSQIRALSELFDQTTLVVPVLEGPAPPGSQALSGHRLTIRPLGRLPRNLLARRLAYALWLPRYGPAIWRACRNADCVHALIPGDIGTFGLLAALAQRKPLFVRYCGDWRRQTTLAQHIWKRLLERCAGGRTVVIATGQHARPPSRRNRKISWIFATSLSKAEIAAHGHPRAHLPSTIPRIIVVCRLERSKGIHLLIDSIPHLAERLPGVRLDVVGDGRELPALRKRVSELDVGKRVTFHRQVNRDRVMELLGKADLFCFPSESEGFPKAVVEALACGLPVVGFPISVLPQLATAGCAVLIDERSPQSIARAVCECLSDTGKYVAMSAIAVKTAANFSLEHWQEEIRDALESAWQPLRESA